MENWFHFIKSTKLSMRRLITFFEFVLKSIGMYWDFDVVDGIYLSFLKVFV